MQDGVPIVIHTCGEFGTHRVTRKIPLWAKLAYTAFVALFVTVLAPSNPMAFLWFCNAAVLITLAGVWLENSLLLSMQALAIFWPHLFWQADMLIQVTTGAKVFAGCGLTPADYMFDPNYPMVNRFLSLQHAWLLYFVLWLLWRLGYDRRALPAQTVCAWVLLPLTYALVGDGRGPAGNVNNILGLSSEPQAWVPSWTWLLFLMVFIPVCHYMPLHFLFRTIFRGRRYQVGGDRL
jgi:hypothetical protein